MGIFAIKKEIGPDMVFRRKADLLYNEIDGEVVMLSIENSEYYGMDKVGSRIWELLEQPFTFKELVAKLIEEYEVSDQQCTMDTLAFINKLTDKKLIYYD
jgi:hypothetical protein